MAIAPTFVLLVHLRAGGAGFSWSDSEGINDNVTMTIRINGSTAVWAPTASLSGVVSFVVQGRSSVDV